MRGVCRKRLRELLASITAWPNADGHGIIVRAQGPVERWLVAPLSMDWVEDGG